MRSNWDPHAVDDWFSILTQHADSTGGLGKTRMAGPYPQSF